MPEWEYQKIDLNELPRKTSDIDVLREAGGDGWELVSILPNNVAYLKREAEDLRSEEMAPRVGADFETQRVPTNGNANSPVVGAYEVKAKYRDPKTNETWSGRGRMANWLKRKQDAGEKIEKYLV